MFQVVSIRREGMFSKEKGSEANAITLADICRMSNTSLIPAKTVHEDFGQ